MKWTWFWHEVSRLMRFGIVGALSLGIYFLFYAVLSRWLWVSGNHTFENALAVFLSSIFNFFGHRHWTFQPKTYHGRQMTRYVFVLFTAIVIQSILFWVGHEFFHLYDFVVAAGASILVAFYTYILHRVYTFRHI